MLKHTALMYIQYQSSIGSFHCFSHIFESLKGNRRAFSVPEGAASYTMHQISFLQQCRLYKENTFVWKNAHVTSLGVFQTDYLSSGVQERTLNLSWNLQA